MIALWSFPAADFSDWAAFVETPQVASHAEYLTLLAAVQADLERSGHAVRRVRMSVSEMRAALAANGLANTPAHRAAILAAAP